jgi:hypothetical protein
MVLNSIKELKEEAIKDAKKVEKVVSVIKKRNKKINE